jgi:hypothetical protein
MYGVFPFKLCITQKIEDEYHFLIDCPIYNNSRKICYQKISELCSNFNNMSDKSKFYNKSFYYYYIWDNRLKNDIHPQFFVLCTVYIIVLRFPSFYIYQFQS